MKTPQFPNPNGIPARIGTIQWTFGVHVQAKISSPIGRRTAEMPTTRTDASGGGLPVSDSGSGLCELMTFRKSGSARMHSIVPTPIPVNDKPVSPADHPRMPAKTKG
ncbi:hypothetical protein MRB53_039840 [Persea americana]|nr:hypothetical protein MRB53_039840 [Persea americana]